MDLYLFSLIRWTLIICRRILEYMAERWLRALPRECFAHGVFTFQLCSSLFIRKLPYTSRATMSNSFQVRRSLPNIILPLVHLTISSGKKLIHTR